MAKRTTKAAVKAVEPETETVAQAEPEPVAPAAQETAAVDPVTSEATAPVDPAATPEIASPATAGGEERHAGTGARRHEGEEPQPSRPGIDSVLQDLAKNGVSASGYATSEFRSLTLRNVSERPPAM